MADRVYSNEPPHGRAETVRSAYWTMDPYAAIAVGDAWYVEIDDYVPAEHYAVKRKLRDRLAPDPLAPPFVHLGVVGAKGTGKTTQVRQAMAGLADDGLQPVYIDVLATLDQGAMAFVDYLLALANAVAGLANDNDWRIDGKLLDEVRLWFAEQLQSEVHCQKLIGSIETSAEAKGGLPWLATLLGKLTASLRTENDYRREVRSVTERDPQQLVQRVNLLLDAVTERLRRDQGDNARLVVVFDNLQKVPDRGLVAKTLFRSADQVRQLRCCLLFFLDPADEFAPALWRASEAMSLVHVPMLPVRQRDDGYEVLDDGVRAAVRAMLDKRADLAAVFADADAAVEQLAVASGGRVRDLFHLARLACELAMDSGRVEPGHVRRALTAEATRRASGVPLASWPRVIQISATKEISKDAADHELALLSHVLQYDGEPWWDVHPLLRLDRRFDEAARQASAGGSPDSDDGRS